MSLYPAPVLHNGSLNQIFNPTDFNSTSKLNSTNVSGPLTVAGLASLNGGAQVSGSLGCSGTITTSNATVTGTLGITSLTTATGGLTIGTSSTLTIPSGKVFSVASTNDIVDTNSSQSISGAKTLTSILNASAGLQQPTPTVLTSSATPTANCLNYSYTTWTLTLSANITGISFTNMRAGGQYVIFITGGGSVFTIANALTGSPAIKTNYATAVSVPATTGKAVLTAYYDGTNMFVSCFAYA